MIMKIGRKILIVGPDRVMPKLFYWSKKMKLLGYEYSIYTHDRPTPELADRVISEFNVNIEYGPEHKRSIVRLIKDFFVFNKFLRRNNFQYAELYSDYHILASFGYLLILYLNQIHIILWCRGELYDWNSFSWWKKFYFKCAFRLSDKIVLKEKYMMDIFDSLNLNVSNKIVELHNSVEIQESERIAPANQEIRILFMNMFKEWRNVTFCIDVAAALKMRGVNFTMNIVGEKQNESPGLDEQSFFLHRKVETYNLEDEVKILPFTHNPKHYYLASDIFILPADLIFCNYSLIEAMGYGLIPFVFDKDKDYKLIIDQGVSGFGLPLNVDVWVENIIALIRNPEAMMNVSNSAKKKIRDFYSLDVVFDKFFNEVGYDNI
jgi:glycosyltransferase involved in cell wall biosynthesis